MIKTVKKLNNGLNGEITIPADKSISHRAIMFSSIAEGECTISNFSNGADCKSTLNLFKQLGTEINYIDEKTVHVKSNGTLKPINGNIFDCGNSGTTMRLASGILAGQNFDSVLTGDTSLSKRPMKRIIEPLEKMGAKIESTIFCKAPLRIFGRKLHGIYWSSDNPSAQVKSCVLLAGLNAEGQTEYHEIYPSRNHTEIMLKYLGADIESTDNYTIIRPSKLVAKDINVVGDISSAAFFIVAGLIVPNSNIIIKNVGGNDTRTGILDIVHKMGGDIEVIEETTQSGEICGTLRVKYTDSLKACEISGKDIPRLIDELPVIAVLASQAEGQTVVKNAEDLRNKESDRITSLVSELKKIGIHIEETPDGFIVEGKHPIKGGAELNSYHDHRLAMSFYIAGLIAEKEIGIDGFEWTKISFPEFEEIMTHLMD